MREQIAFIGGGNMASALIGGLLKQGLCAEKISVVEPFEQARSKLLADFGISALEQSGPALAQASLVVWAVKPQTFRPAAEATHAYTRQALHLSVAAGIRSDSIARWLGTERVVRSMPNTPALIGQGMTALFGREGVTPNDRQVVEQVIRPTGQYLWLEAEDQLDAVTALSGSGPAYVFYFLEAMIRAGTEMGLTLQQARQLAIQTFIGSSELARSSSDDLSVLRQRVTSKGGTTYAAITAMEQAQMQTLFIQALQAARHRAQELGEEFGAQ
ncbi:MAG: pyrroline-5-carboxylate reductase [Burkholderiaceae bacterium]